MGGPPQPRDHPTCDVCDELVTEDGKWRHEDCEPPPTPLVKCLHCGKWRLQGLRERYDHERRCEGLAQRRADELEQAAFLGLDKAG